MRSISRRSVLSLPLVAAVGSEAASQCEVTCGSRFISMRDAITKAFNDIAAAASRGDVCPNRAILRREAERACLHCFCSAVLSRASAGVPQSMAAEPYTEEEMALLLVLAEAGLVIPDGLEVTAEQWVELGHAAGRVVALPICFQVVPRAVAHRGSTKVSSIEDRCSSAFRIHGPPRAR